MLLKQGQTHKVIFSPKMNKYRAGALREGALAIHTCIHRCIYIHEHTHTDTERKK